MSAVQDISGTVSRDMKAGLGVQYGENPGIGIPGGSGAPAAQTERRRSRPECASGSDELKC